MEFLELIETALGYAPQEYDSVVASFKTLLPWLVLAVTLLTCFFGHKIHKLWLAFLFFCIGFVAGAFVGILFPAGTAIEPFIMLGLILGVLAAYYSGKLRRLQLFVLNAFFVFATMPGVLSGLIPPVQALLLSAVAAIVVGILAAKYQHLVTTITTALSSGLSAGPMLLALGQYTNEVLSLALGAALGIAGLLFQLLPEWKEWRENRREAQQEDAPGEPREDPPEEPREDPPVEPQEEPPEPQK